MNGVSRNAVDKVGELGGENLESSLSVLASVPSELEGGRLQQQRAAFSREGAAETEWRTAMERILVSSEQNAWGGG